MPWTKERLQAEYNLADEEVLKTLKVCGLPVDEDEYSDQDIESKFKLVRSYFDSNRTDTYTGAADLLALEQGGEAPIDDAVQPDSHALTKKSGRGRKSKGSTDNDVESKMLSMFELLERASKQCGKKITYKELPQIMDVCGLPDEEPYTLEEGDRFLEGCVMVKLQNKSYSEVAAYFGGENSSSSDLQSQLQQIVAKFSDSATVAESELLDLASRIAKKQVDATDIDIDQLMRRLYLIEVSRKAAKQRDKNDTIFAEIEQRVLDQIEGKSPVRSLQAIWDRQMNSLPPSSTKPMSLLEESDNGTSAS